jgi:nucleoside phosphorylase
MYATDEVTMQRNVVNMAVQTKEISFSDFEKHIKLDAIGTAVIVATDRELAAAIGSMQPLPGYDFPLKIYQGNQTYYIGVIGVFPVVLVMITMMGSLKRDASFATVSEMIKHWAPKLMIMEGIAFGRDNQKQKIGDILISETLSQYETAKQRPDGEIITRGHSVASSPILLNRFTQDHHWFNNFTQENVAVKKCEILSGEKLIDDLVTRDELFKRFPNAQGGEMEGNGVYAACDKEKISWIICKSICDWADGNKSNEWQDIAANNAAQYVSHILSSNTAFESAGVYCIERLTQEGVFQEEKPTYHDIRGSEIVKIIYPRHEVLDSYTASIPKDRIYYQFYSVLVTERVKIGYVFFAKNVNQDRAIRHFLSKYDKECDSLIVCSPRIRSEISGRDDYRLSSIKTKFYSQDRTLQKANIEFSYIDDIVWKHSLGHDKLLLKYDIPDEKYFIDQEITSTASPRNIFQKKSLVFFNEVFNSDSRDKPLIAVVGGAGAGKTTLCDQLIKLVELHKKKKAIYISSNDIYANIAISDVNTVSDLYKLSCGEQGDDADSLLDPTNLEINISCGNIVVVIDGLDEIEAKLKDRFNFDDFIQDAVNLNESYNNCTIVVTSRDYYKNKYEENQHIELVSLYGFDDALASSYFDRRLPSHLIGKAKRQLAVINASSHGFYPPVILSLICDVLESEEKAKKENNDDGVSSSRYLDTTRALDYLVIKLIDREITRQSLKMSVDDVLDVLMQIAARDGDQISKKELDSFLEIYVTDQLGTSFVSFYTSPLLRSSPNNEFVGYRYDAILILLRSRYFIYCICAKSEDFDFIKFALREFYDGDSDLLLDIIENQNLPESVVFSGAKRVLKRLVSEHEDHLLRGNRKSLEQSKKYISAILYYYFRSNAGLSRDERTIKLMDLYDKHVQYFFVYGEFFALDFSMLEVRDSGFYDYSNFEKSNFPINKKVFFTTEFRDIAPKARVDAEIGIFDSSCELNKRLKHAVVKGKENRAELMALIKNDFILLFSVLYRNRSFVKKSENIFKTKRAKIYPKLSMQDYLSFFIETGVFGKERSHTSNSKYHYFVEDTFKDDVRYLITNGNFRGSLESIYKSFIVKRLGLDI